MTPEQRKHLEELARTLTSDDEPGFTDGESTEAIRAVLARVDEAEGLLLEVLDNWNECESCEERTPAPVVDRVRAFLASPSQGETEPRYTLAEVREAWDQVWREKGPNDLGASMAWNYAWEDLRAALQRKPE